MNEQLRPASLSLTTQAAEGLPRRRWTVAELEEMVPKGIIAEDERIELIGGEVVPMSPKGRRHESIRCELAFQMSRQAPASLRVAVEVQFNLADDAYLVPNILVYPAATRVHDVRGPSALLVVEIADSSLAYDLDTNAGIYAGMRRARVLGHQRQNAGDPGALRALGRRIQRRYWFGYDGPAIASEHDRGVKLGEIVGAKRALLILDGIEPLQDLPIQDTGGMRGGATTACAG